MDAFGVTRDSDQSGEAGQTACGLDPKGASAGRRHRPDAGCMTNLAQYRAVAEAATPCPNFEDHTVQPEGYLQWHAWAQKMGKTYRQRKCSGCGLYAIWEKEAQP